MSNEIFTTLVNRVALERDASRDLLVPNSKMVFGNNMNMGIAFTQSNITPLVPNTVAHEHVAQYLGVPMAFYKRQKEENPDLLSAFCQGLIHRTNGKRMLRTYDDGKHTPILRAVVSPSYRRLDNYDLLNAIAPTVMERGDVEFVNGTITERRMYLTATFRSMEADIKVNDTVRAGFRVSNSEVRCGTVKVEPFLYRLVCLNGMTVKHTLNIRHAGAGLVEDEDTMEVLTDSTREARDRATWMEVRDLVKACVTPNMFNRWVDQAREAAGNEIKKDTVDVIENVTKTYKLTNDEHKNVLEAMLNATGNDRNAWGLANAVTAVGRETEDFDRRAELERIGGEIISLKRTDWSRLAA